ncbi:hypothetical protein Phi40:1_gp045 [Cellulophaga phage phi40:1]|uniref:Uncharacterized protein n=1 Tax=Cellulophaga phage phi38:1 TaxID=1327977 RepID=R9ZZY3_9CAUD|nr:hypothetical protein Phi38:1_gp045 [Cellulophaga phage phi38:1]AGO47910.1 hypothetical protein Phi40:1_gp045 [Cellulophaga phage phi40:1]AGO48075.1 hypothetical protein Phi38:1_gp045 [Cellulophaga phage phi38:1]|tara:strand:- start:304 stop:447 length:144 start_codon:yes stop_codon:yes gene_type:complete
MAMDLDYVFAMEAIEKLEQKLDSIPHGEREQIADDINSMADAILSKY